ncbi:MAG: hypothetical protein IT371_18060 [Deltaproteobacteria bacterium]|nr:hypothetical protein [Deltaproteobacteria bacterium]
MTHGVIRRTGFRTGPREQAPAARVVDALVSAPDSRGQVRQLPSIVLHRLVAEIGLGDAVDLVALASPDQIRGVLDLQVWQGDRLDSDELLDWLYTLAALPEDARRRNLNALDVELVGWLFAARTRIYLLAEQEPPDEPEGPIYRTPDGWFALEILEADEASFERLVQLLETMYGDDADAARRLLQTLTWELPSELEEMALRWRNGRLEDLGFVDPLTALSLYTYLDPGSVTLDERTFDRADPSSTTAPSLELVPLLQVEGSTFLGRALAALTDPAERARLGHALLTLSNWALAADRVAPTDVEGARTSLVALHHRLSLALEVLAHGEPARGAEFLGRVAVLRLARVGHSLTLALRERLRPLARQGLLGRTPRAVDLLDEPLGSRIAGLLALRPYFVDAREGPRPFLTRADLAEAAGWVEEAAMATALVPKGTWPSPLPDELTLGDLFRTALARQVAGGEGPLAQPELARFLAQVLPLETRGAELRTAALRLAEARLGVAPGPVATRVVEGWLDGLAAAVQALRVDDLDLRFVSGFHLRRAGGAPN